MEWAVALKARVKYNWSGPLCEEPSSFCEAVIYYPYDEKRSHQQSCPKRKRRLSGGDEMKILHKLMLFKGGLSMKGEPTVTKLAHISEFVVFPGAMMAALWYCPEDDPTRRPAV